MWSPNSDFSQGAGTLYPDSKHWSGPIKHERAHIETNVLVPIRVAPQARTQRRATSVGNEHTFKYYKLLKEMKTLRDY